VAYDIIDNNDHIKFKTKRLLDTSDPNDFVIPLDYAFIVNWAGCPCSQRMNYHGNNIGWFSVQMTSDFADITVMNKCYPVGDSCCCYS
jgi:hypothetical protein